MAREDGFYVAQAQGIRHFIHRLVEARDQLDTVIDRENTAPCADDAPYLIMRRQLTNLLVTAEGQLDAVDAMIG